MTFLEFNMKLNEIISAWLEDGGDPACCADALRMAADEVFEEVEVLGGGDGGLTWAQAKVAR
ncbi:MAG: hypothetical protein JW395_0638 [Nitrospira sp.]|nr:hypothetical protein [Nitrospira sp.]